MNKTIGIKEDKKLKKSHRNTQGAWILFLQNLKRDKLALFGIIVLIILIGVGVLADVIAPYEPTERHYSEAGEIKRLESPSKEHWFGTTDVGRDIFSQVILGTRTALTVGILAAFLTTFVGASVGIISGFYGGDYRLHTYEGSRLLLRHTLYTICNSPISST